MQYRLVFFTGAQLQHPVFQPSDVLQQQAAIVAQLGFHMINQRMRQHLSAFDNHLVGILITVVAGLREDRNFFFTYGCTVFFGNYFTHQFMFAFSHGVQNSLGYAVTQCRMDGLACFSVLHGVDFFRQGFEGIQFTPYQTRLDFLFNHRNEIFRQEQGIPSAGAAVLHRSAIAVSNLAVFQHQHHRYGFAGLANRLEAGCYRVS